MTIENPHASGNSSWLRQLAGSALSALAGLAALLIVLLVEAVVSNHGEGAGLEEKLIVALVICGFAALYVVGTWLLFLIPLYFLVPPQSWLWRWPVCTSLGAGSGALILWACAGFQADDSVGVFCALAALTGGSTCLFGSLTRDRFQKAMAR